MPSDATLIAEIADLRQRLAWKDDAMHVLYESVLTGKASGLFTPEQVRALDIGFGFDGQGECEAAKRADNPYLDGTEESRLHAELADLRQKLEAAEREKMRLLAESKRLALGLTRMQRMASEENARSLAAEAALERAREALRSLRQAVMNADADGRIKPYMDAAKVVLEEKP